MNDTDTPIRTNKGNPLWVKGYAPNPLGRPKKIKCIPDILKKIGDIADAVLILPEMAGMKADILPVRILQTDS